MVIFPAKEAPIDLHRAFSLSPSFQPKSRRQFNPNVLPMTGGARANTSATTTPPRFKRTASRRCSKRAIKAVQAKTDGDDAKVEVSVDIVGPVTRRLLVLQLGSILPLSFFEIDWLDLAPGLLGKCLRRDDVVLQITEVEAYRPNDSACHGRVDATLRTAPLASTILFVLGQILSTLLLKFINDASANYTLVQ